MLTVRFCFLMGQMYFRLEIDVVTELHCVPLELKGAKLPLYKVAV